MSTLYITEYARVAVDGRGGMILAGEEPGVDQSPIAISGTTARSAAFSTSTTLVRVHTDVICSINFGGAGINATTNNKRLAANQTEFFGITPGATNLAVIANT